MRVLRAYCVEETVPEGGMLKRGIVFALALYAGVLVMG
jgi:hypothetical protein